MGNDISFIYGPAIKARTPKLAGQLIAKLEPALHRSDGGLGEPSGSSRPQKDSEAARLDDPEDDEDELDAAYGSEYFTYESGSGWLFYGGRMFNQLDEGEISVQTPSALRQEVSEFEALLREAGVPGAVKIVLVSAPDFI